MTKFHICSTGVRDYVNPHPKWRKYLYILVIRPILKIRTLAISPTKHCSFR